jgi:hypothetical protein
MALLATDLQLLRQFLVEAELRCSKRSSRRAERGDHAGAQLYAELVRSYQKLRADITAGAEQYDMHGVLRAMLALSGKERDYQDSSGEKARGRQT